MSSDQMERRLIEAAQKGKIDELNGLIGSNALVLEETALKGAGHTPLHIACLAGHLDFARELLKLMPKFAEKVNADGFSPLHIAAGRGDVEIARELLSMGQHLCHVKGWERRIPLHFAVVNGEVDVMKLLLSASPASIEETTAREETALHLAVKNNRFDALAVLVEHLKQNEKEQVINWKDHKGNTPLHLAAAAKNFEVVDFMLRGQALESEVMEVNASNESGLTSLDVSTLSRRGAGDGEITEILTRAGAVNARGRPNSPDSGPVSVDGNDIEGANTHQSDGEPVTNAPQSFSRLRSRNLIKEKESLGDARNALLVVAALIASATYQAVLQPPNFTPKVINDYPKGFLGSFGSFMTSPLRRDIVYIIFVSGNTLGLFVSVQMIICLTRDLPVKLPLMLSLSAMILTYLCYMSYLPYASMDRHFRLMNVDLLAALPLIIVVLLLLTQRWLARGMEHFFEKLSRFNLLGGMYNLKT